MTVPISDIALAEYPFQIRFNTNVHLALDLGVRKTAGILPGLFEKIFVSSEQKPSLASIATFCSPPRPPKPPPRPEKPPRPPPRNDILML